MMKKTCTMADKYHKAAHYEVVC